ncbi:hypothetical protein DWZ16_04565 [Clostridium sp. AF29-8BH]|uniref:hypothetical protein n=1 Tax=Clostridium sp. AF29-8BH TaxID=2293009 RepID=UPI000E515782|nr:hypothetical protein DWZ16_04565 [Clostridium sp. AF29-8BH]
MAVDNIDLSGEIKAWKDAAYGKDVRAANVAAFEKIQGTVNDTVQNVNQASKDASSASQNAQKAVDDIQSAIETATSKASEAAGSATAADTSKKAAASSAAAADNSKTQAAASAAEAKKIAQGLGDFDGTAAKVKTTDTYGLVVSALGESTAQALIDAIANKVMNELINKNKIVNNLLATDASTVLAGTQGAALDKRLVAAENAVTKLNSELSEKAKITNISSLSSIGDIFKTYSKNGSIPVIGIINWDTTLAPDQNVTIAFVWNYLIVAISSSGCIYTASPNAATWQKRN